MTFHFLFNVELLASVALRRADRKPPSRSDGPFLYREWFVHFRFPGHDKVKMVSSPLGPIPQGWEVTTFGNLYNTGSGGTPSRTRPDYFENGTIDWVKSQELLDRFILSTEERITEQALRESSAKLSERYSSNCTLWCDHWETCDSFAASFDKSGVLQLSQSVNRMVEFAFLTLLLT
jgi:hypothetical protein